LNLLFEGSLLRSMAIKQAHQQTNTDHVEMTARRKCRVVVFIEKVTAKSKDENPLPT